MIAQTTGATGATAPPQVRWRETYTTTGTNDLPTMVVVVVSPPLVVENWNVERFLAEARRRPRQAPRPRSWPPFPHVALRRLPMPEIAPVLAPRAPLRAFRRLHDRQSVPSRTRRRRRTWERPTRKDR